MKHLFTLLFLFPFVLLKAQISPGYAMICAATPCVSFNDATPNAVSWYWDFGDPASGPNNNSTQQVPTHCYSGVGYYNVTLVVTLANSSTSTWTAAVEVVPNPVAAFTSANIGGNTVQFTDQSTGGGVVWIWDFGDASSPGTTQNPVHPYPSSNTYSVTLTVIDTNGCISTTSEQVTATPTGIDVLADESFQLLPNPANEALTVETGSAAPVIFEMQNTLGQPVLRRTEQDSRFTVDVSALPAGTYFVRMQSGEKVTQQKLVIAR